MFYFTLPSFYTISKFYEKRLLLSKSCSILSWQSGGGKTITNDINEFDVISQQINSNLTLSGTCEIYQGN